LVLKLLLQLNTAKTNAPVLHQLTLHCKRIIPILPKSN